MAKKSKARLGVTRIVSGGQTGVDRAALDVAIQLGIPHGGWCPRGRLAEDGPISLRYELRELDSTDYADRTRQNVVDSDGTLILYTRRLTGGTALTNRIAKELNKPLHRLRLDLDIDLAEVVDWLAAHRIGTLNVAGPRGSGNPGLYEQASQTLLNLFQSTPLLDRLS